MQCGRGHRRHRAGMPGLGSKRMTTDGSNGRGGAAMPAAWVIATACLLATGFACAQGTAAAQKTPLVVYTAFGEAQARAYKQAFEKANPDVDIRWTSGSSPALAARLISE